MSCFPCFGSQRSKNARRSEHPPTMPVEQQEMKEHRPAEAHSQQHSAHTRQRTPSNVEFDVSQINGKSYTFRELASATKNFRQECLLGEGGFGRVYKGTLQSTGQMVAVKQLDRNGTHGSREFLVEVRALSLLNHPNIVSLIGYCADGDQRLLVHEFIPGGTLEDRVLDNQTGKMTLDWYTRIKIAYGAALGLEYLHQVADPPVVYRDFKSSNILLDEEFNPKLSDVGLAKLSNDGDKMHGPSRLMGAYGFCAPEYSRTGEVSNKSDVYSFGVILLELLTGRRAIDTTRTNDEQNLVAWAQPYFRDPKKFPQMADHRLNKQFPEKDLNQAVAIAAMCLQEEADVRPFMSDVVATLSYLSKSPPCVETPVPVPDPITDNQDDNSASSSDISGDEESNGERSDNESSRSSDNNPGNGAEEKSGKDDNGRDLRQVSGVDSKQWHSFERDGSFSSGEQKSKSKSDKGDQDTHQDKGDQDTHQDKSDQDTHQNTTSNKEECVSDSNNRVAQTEENSKSVSTLDRATSHREPESMNVPSITA